MKNKKGTYYLNEVLNDSPSNPDEVIVLHEVESHITGREGRLLETKNLKTQSREELINFWKGKTVNNCTVVGVESQATMTIPEGAPIRLLVK